MNYHIKIYTNPNYLRDKLLSLIQAHFALSSVIKAAVKSCDIHPFFFFKLHQNENQLCDCLKNGGNPNWNHVI